MDKIKIGNRVIKYSDMGWKELGLFFGYPECCIESFLKMHHIGKPPRKLDGSGYIPCEKCNKKSEAFLISAINKRRLAKSSFPEDGGFESFLA